MTDFHVSKKGSDNQSGTIENPFQTIQKAADCALAGDRVIIHAGVYRECVCPRNAGKSNNRRITYEASKNEKVVITGSEIIKDWEILSGTVWVKKVSNKLFQGFNPFEREIWGDWLESDRKTHLGEVYINGQAMYEATTLDQVIEGSEIKQVREFFTGIIKQNPYMNKSKYLWFAEVMEEETTIFANFHEINPNEQLTEINVRGTCFYPEKTGIDYITVRGLELCQAACQWAPPTGNQEGLLGPHWSKGWVIEDNIIHDAKASGISLGKDGTTGDNEYSNELQKPGYTFQLETVFRAYEFGWNEEHVGGHVIRHNHIYNCGQNGIVGHLGAIFSEIYENKIHDISMKREFYGWEIAAIKLHAAIDVRIYNNFLYNSEAGMWLDWQTQGTYIGKNVFYSNGLDFFVEVSHGPYVVDHNIFASDFSIRNFSQGGAYINNLIAGDVAISDILDRSTPYHLPHSTKMKGFSVIFGGDDRWYNNILLAKNNGRGLEEYNDHTTSMEEYVQKVQQEAPTDVQGFMNQKAPVYINQNAYLSPTNAFVREIDNVITSEKAIIKVNTFNEEISLELELPQEIIDKKCMIQTTKSLGHVRLVDADFEQRDGSPYVLDVDLLNKKSEVSIPLGPLSNLKHGKNYIEILF